MPINNSSQEARSLGDSLDALAQQLNATAEAIRSCTTSLDDLDDERARVVNAAEALLKDINPADPVMTSMISMVQFTAIRLFVGWKAFDIMASAGTISVADLAGKLDADVSLIRRLTGILTSTGVLKQLDNDSLSMTPASTSFSQTSFDDHLKALHSTPAYFDQYGRKEPTGRYDTIHAFAAGDPKLTVWEHTNRDPVKKSYFMTAMMAMASRMPTTGSYNFAWVLDKMHEAPDRALVVDVGGGKGHALQAIQKVTPGLPMSRCVVEDLQAVVDEAKKTATGELADAQYVSMDFHSEQPVKGACIYYIRRCLHDYGDDVCVEILQQLRDAMVEDSRVLIVEQVLSDPPLPMAAATDIYMATIGVVAVMAPTPDELSAPGAVSYDSNTMSVGDGTWDFTKNSFLLPNLQGLNFETMRYNGMANRFRTLDQYHRIVLAHGIMAAIVFLLLVPVSVMMARFYSSRPGYAIAYHAQIHVFAGLMVLVVFILGFFAVGPERNLTNPHHGIGVAIFVMFILQLVGGRLVRHITKLRSLRIMIHQWSGRAIALLGIVQVPLGLTLYGSPKYLFILYALWMTFLLVVYFFLSWRSAGRRELYMGGARSEGGRTRITESEFFSDADPKQHKGGWSKWLGPLAAGAGIWALLRGRKKDRDRARSRSRSRSRSSFSRSRAPEVMSSRRGSGTYLTEKYSELPPEKSGGGGFMKVLGGAAAAIGAGKLVSGFMNRRRDRRDEEYSAVSTETPRRYRSGRGAPTMTELSSEVTDDYTRDPRDATQTSLLPPSANRGGMTAGMAAGRSAVDSRDPRRPTTPRPMHARGHSGHDFEDSDYSSYVSPSRRPVDGKGGGGGFAKGILGGLGMGWFAKKMADRRAKKEEDRLREEEDMRSGTQVSRFTGDGYPSPTRKSSRRPAPVRRPTGYARGGTEISDVTESSIDSRPAAGTYGAPMPPAAGYPPAPPGGPGSHSRQHVEPVSMPAMPPDPHGVLHSEAEGSFLSSGGDSRPPQRRASSRRRRAGDRAAAAAAARAGSLAADEGHSHLDERQRYGSPQSQPVSVKLKVHDDRDRNVTLRRLTEEEAAAARGPRSRGDSESSLSGLESPSYGRGYRRDSSQRRMERAAERAAERRAAAAAASDDKLAPLSPPNPAFAKGGRKTKDSAYYSGQPGPSGTAPVAGQTVSSLGSPESHGTWSAMSMSPGGPDKGPESVAADDRRRRRRQERRAASSTTRPSGVDMFD
ncbi:cytochrome b561/ferric reductase transmembrane [Purpureocillium lilacinum]|uniref:Cytochrome b561/ferric reductase transmembrane n=1 Tax=Purpureocillium lilacinum TaxID=33203 RepID=A0A179HCU9_PURLI|nr:cytochrome b561/ferric reductase transmembrane [Purpureocillium lilacinum]